MTNEQKVEKFAENLTLRKWHMYEINIICKPENEEASECVGVDLEVGDTPELLKGYEINAATLNGAVAHAKALAVADIRQLDDDYSPSMYVTLFQEHIIDDEKFLLSCGVYNSVLDSTSHREYIVSLMD